MDGDFKLVKDMKKRTQMSSLIADRIKYGELAAYYSKIQPRDFLKFNTYLRKADILIKSDFPMR